jgi:integrator complex subunit 11
MRRVAVERKGETNFFTSQMIKDCMKKVVACNLHQVVKVDDELEIKAYYAGKYKYICLFSENVVITIFGVLKNMEGKYSRDYIHKIPW